MKIRKVVICKGIKLPNGEMMEKIKKKVYIYFSRIRIVKLELELQSRIGKDQRE